ncbi:MAG: amidohydrolase family protein, partial [Paraclostridium sp.]
MTQIYRGNVLFTKNKEEFEIIEKGYIVVNCGKVVNVCRELPSEYKDIDVIDYEDKLIIPGMNDLHCHAPQFRNLGMAMDMELLPWLENYTFPEESKYKDLSYADKMYKRFIKEIWKSGTTRIAVFATVHKEASMRLIDLFKEAGLGALVGKVNMNINCIDDLLEDTEQSISDTKEIIEKY